MMKTKGQLIQKIKQVRFRYLKKFIDKCLAKSSVNCVYNRPSSFEVEGVTKVGLCGHSMETRDWVAQPCDKRVNPMKAEDCPHFVPLNTKEELKEEFNSSIDSLPISAIASKFPDMAALLWVLSEDLEDDNG